jgi:hypothetical protein
MSDMYKNMKEMYESIELKPDQFKEYLLHEIGFKTCELLIEDGAKGKGASL